MTKADGLKASEYKIDSLPFIPTGGDRAQDIIRAIRHGDNISAFKLLSKTTDLSGTDQDGWTVAMHAVQAQNTLLVRRLMQCKDVNWALPNEYGESPLMIAQVTGTPQIKALVRKAAAKQSMAALESSDRLMQIMKKQNKG